jgi:hypothetical protein
MSTSVHRTMFAHMLGPWVVIDSAEIVAVCEHQHHADRIAELIRTHGMADVPADASAIEDRP